MKKERLVSDKGKNSLTQNGAGAILCYIGALWLSGSSVAQTIPSFADETKTSGIESIYKGDWQYMVGGGVAAFDCDGDQMQDVFLAGGENKSKLYRNRSAKGGALKFEEVASEASFEAVTGAYPLDIDSDGNVDLVVLRVGENVLLRGKGNCAFERANEMWNFAGGDGWSTAFSATWEKGNQWPTLAIGNYIDREQEIAPWGSCTANVLYRPHTEQNGFAAPTELKPSHCALSMLFSDWNRSGTPSLRVSNDREYYEGGQEQLWKVQKDKSPALYTADEGWKPYKLWGMGLASADVTGDGKPEYFMSSMADQVLHMLANDPSKPAYKSAPFTMGTTAHRPYTGGDVRPSTGWHTQFEDVNNDGRADLFIAKGNVDAMPDFATKDPNNLLLQKDDGTFVEAGDKAGVASMSMGRGAILEDFNRDGKIDLLVVNRRSNVELWRNTSGDIGNFVAIAPELTGSNLNAIGAWVEVRVGERVIARENFSGGGHVSGKLGALHMGVGGATEAEARVIWPGGDTSEWTKLKANEFYEWRKGNVPAVQ
jgi:enediyne biosynthesis protein E4